MLKFKYKIPIIFSLIILFISCTDNEEEEEKTNSNSNIKISEMSSKIDTNESQKKLELIDLKLGNNDEVKKGATVKVHYVGYLANGSVIGDTYKTNKPILINLASGRIIPGWEIGIIGMKEGGKRKLKIPPHLAYGSGGISGLIPPDSETIFEIELLEIMPYH